jgi:large subunit ribosomal protein L13e
MLQYPKSVACSVLKFNLTDRSFFLHPTQDWQRRVKVWFDQPGAKKRRRNARAAKAAKLGLKPIKSLRPAVRCPTLKYNTKLRQGKGFTLEEIKAAGLNRLYARSVGIPVDHRRRNRSEESLKANVERLQAYKARVVTVPARTKQNKGKKADLKSLDITRDVNAAFPIPAGVVPEKARAITAEEKEFDAFHTLRIARATHRHAGVKAAREKKAAEEAAAAKK